MNTEEFRKPQKRKLIINSQGSLGLLALGDIGLREWRKVKRKALKNGNQ